MKTSCLIFLFVLGIIADINASNLVLSGTWQYSINYSQRTINLSGGGIENKEPGSKTGTVKIKLYLTAEKYSGGTISGYVLGESKFDQLSGEDQYKNISKTMSYNYEPPSGTYFVTLVLLEYTSGGYVIKDHQTLLDTLTFKNSGSNRKAALLEQDYLTLDKDQNINTHNSRQILEACYECHGSGRCTVCSGTGRNGNVGKPQVCEVCRGSGVCTRCKGSKFER